MEVVHLQHGYPSSCFWSEIDIFRILGCVLFTFLMGFQNVQNRDFRVFRILGVPYTRQVGVFFSKMSIFAIFSVFGHFFQNLCHFNLQTRGKFFSDYM